MKNFFENKPFKAKPLTWGIASLISIGLLTTVIAHVDFTETVNILKQTSWVFLGGALFALFLEGCVTALRLWVFAAKKTPVKQGFKANAWYVLLLIMLPARLGEVAAIFVLERYMGQKYGAAAMSLIVQRLYDIIILSLIFVMTIATISLSIDRNILILSAVMIMVFSFFVIAKLDWFLSIGAIILPKRPTGALRKIKRLLLQGRSYVRHTLRKRDIPLALCLTVLKWISNLGALSMLFMAVHLNLEMFENVAVAAAYNFLAIVPLQTIGGIGVGEAGLALLLVGMGVSKSVAAGVSLIIRFVILAFPFIFWALVMSFTKLMEKR